MHHTLLPSLFSRLSALSPRPSLIIRRRDCRKPGSLLTSALLLLLPLLPLLFFNYSSQLLFISYQCCRLFHHTFLARQCLDRITISPCARFS